MILYLHGFNSSGASAKGRYLREHLPDIPVRTPTLSHDPAVAIATLYREVEQHPAGSLLLAGASLGGYYAQHLAHRYRLPMLLINPALLPLATLEDYLGENTNYYTGEKWTLTSQHLAALRALDVPNPCQDPVPALLLLDAGDEVLDYRLAQQRYRACAEVIVYADGDHAFQHLAEALPSIRAFYQRAAGNSGSNTGGPAG